jgi:hypothetical protein
MWARMRRSRLIGMKLYSYLLQSIPKGTHEGILHLGLLDLRTLSIVQHSKQNTKFRKLDVPVLVWKVKEGPAQLGHLTASRGWMAETKIY